MAIKNKNKGFAILIAVILMSVMLTFGLSLGSLAYKQQVLASEAIKSQYAFYAADAALECVLYADQQQGALVYPTTQPTDAPTINCDEFASVSSGVAWSASPASWNLAYRFSLDGETRCADVKITKPQSGITSVYSQGFDVSCDVLADPGSARFVSRGLMVSYTN